MTLNDKITQDLKEAMKAGEKIRLETLRTLRAQMIELSKRGSEYTITQDDEMAVLIAAMKKRKEAIDIYEKAGRTDLASQEKQELEIISHYLPKQLTVEEAAMIVAKIITDLGANSSKDFGKVMPLAIKELKGKIDGKIVQEIVKSRLRS
ncbi:MAG: GatB/YqeY domain-containing protein [bacterium]